MRALVALPMFMLWVACAGAPPAGEATLVLTMTPRTIVTTGEKSTIRVVATTAQGTVGAGDVVLRSSIGSLRTPVTLTLDAYGTAKTTFSCDRTLDPRCVAGGAEITATWTLPDRIVRGSIRAQLQDPPVFWENGVSFPGGGSPSPCASGGANTNPTPCDNGACARGFTCVEGLCLLNGGSGGIQFTLRFNKPVDLDLHTSEPLADAGVCHTYFGNTGRGQPNQCGGTGSLDLDSNAACNLDNVDIENIIFPSGRPSPGVYSGWVHRYAACMVPGDLEFELQLRAGALSRYYCGVLNAANETSPAYDIIVP